MVSLQQMPQLLFDQIALNGVLSRQNRALRAVRVVKHPEDDLGQRVRGGRVMRRRHHLRQRVLQHLAQHGVKRKVRPVDVLLDPHLASKALDLLPQAVQILKSKPIIQCYFISMGYLFFTSSCGCGLSEVNVLSAL